MIPQRAGSVIHRVMLGVDLLKNTGEGLGSGDVFNETVFFYNVEAAFSRDRKFSAIAGCFPRSFSEGYYDGVFFSDKVIFLDNNFEGMFFKYRTPDFYAELGLDWMGKIGGEDNPFRRERFQVLTSGLWNFAGPFSLGWAGTFYHFANAPQLANIVDNNLLNVYAMWSPHTALEKIEVSLGGICSYQYDRAIDDRMIFPGGFLTTQNLENWNIGILNTFYCGNDMFPFYGGSYGGVPYGADLYFGEPCYHSPDGGNIWNDRLNIYYAPKIADFLQVRFGIEFHLGTAFEDLDVTAFHGWRQTLSLRFDLSALRPGAKPLKRRGFRFGDLFDL